MKRLLLALALAWSLSAFAQAPYQRNTFTTNTDASLVGNVSPTYLNWGLGFPVHTVYAGPTNGIVGTPTARLLIAEDLPTSYSATNTFNYVTITNLSVLNSVTVSNISVTNLTVQTINITTNLYNVAKGGHLTITNDVNLLSLKTNLLAVTSTGLITNANYGSGITWTPSTLTLSASSGTTVSVNATNVTTPNLQDTATVTWGVSGSNLTATAVSSGGGSLTVNATNVSTPNLKDTSDITWAIATATNAQPSFAALTWNALTYSASNVVMDCSLGNSQVAHYKLLLTNSTTQFGIPTSIPTVPKTFWIWFQQDSTGVRTVQWTNTTFKFPQATQPVIDTNANAVTLIEFTTNPFTNSVLGYVGIVPRIQ